MSFRQLLVALAVLVAVLPSAPVAEAGTYRVLACDAAVGPSSSWTPVAGRGMLAYAKCPSAGKESFGLVMRNDPHAPFAFANAAASMTFAAPPGTELVDMSYIWRGARANGGWQLGIVGDRGGFLTGCRAGSSVSGQACTVGQGPQDPRARSIALPGRTSVKFEVRCAAFPACYIPPSKGGSGAGTARLQVYSASVTVKDLSPPQVTATGGGLWESRWVRGTQEAAFDASDNVGIRTTRFSVDGALRSGEDRGCDFTRSVPCSNVSNGRYQVETKSLSDGLHRFGIEAVDAAGNSASADRFLAVDNNPPGRLEGVSVDGGDQWRSTNSFAVRWSNPVDQAAPIVRAHYRLCATNRGAKCTSGSVDGHDIAELGGLTVPAPGEYDLRVWLEDEAGNVDPDNASDPVKLRFDDVAPGEAKPKRRNGWVGAVEAAKFEQRISPPNKDAVPASGISGYSFTSDGSDPDGTPETASDIHVFADLPEGSVIIKARAISGAGVPSSQVGSTEVKVDKTPPIAEIVAPPEPDRWLQQAVVLSIRGADQPGLSGLEAAAADDAVSEGGYVAYRLDGGDLRRVRGGAADVGVATDGQHALVYQAVDVAGNQSPEHTVEFRVDATAPEELAFEPQDPADPRRLTAVAADRTSGVAGGGIEIRRSGQADWSSLETTFENGRLSAYVDDIALERGIYEFRARATDVAGNERVSDRRRDGAKMELSNPVRPETRIAATISPAARVKTARGGKLRRTDVRFGAAALVRGRLTHVDGRGLGNAQVAVSARAQSLGSAFRPLAGVRTDADGYFQVRISAGPSRAVRLAYEGDATNGPSARFVAMRVPAFSTLQVNRTQVRNRGRVSFNGRLLGRPLPPGGKLIELQAYFRGEWRTFRTVRTRRGGQFRARYRFGATTTLVRYLFRVRVSRDASYPYEEGLSHTVAVMVDGRRRR